ncbi:glycosyltransferase family 4 protein [Chloroflexota bacterium]
MPTKPRIAFIHSQISPYRLPLFREIAQAPDFDLCVFFLIDRTPDREWAITTNLDFEHVILNGTTFKLPGGRNFKGEARLVNLNFDLLPALHRWQPDIVICFEFSLPTLMTFPYTRLYKKVFISWSEPPPYVERNLTFMQRQMRQWVIPRAEACIAVSSGAKEKYLSYGAAAEHTHIGIQTVDTEFYRQQASHDARSVTLREEHNIPADSSVIINVGSLIERKGNTHLLQAFTLANQQLPNTHLVLVGSGELQEALQAQAVTLGIAEQVHFAGFCDQQTTAGWYHTADLFAFSTLEDTFGLVVNEAMASGLPVLSSIYAGATADLVREGENGYPIDPTDHQHFADLMIHILSQPELAWQMGQESQHIIANFGIAESAAGYVAAIRDVIQQMHHS